MATSRSPLLPQSADDGAEVPSTMPISPLCLVTPRQPPKCRHAGSKYVVAAIAERWKITSRRHNAVGEASGNFRSIGRSSAKAVSVVKTPVV